MLEYRVHTNLSEGMAFKNGRTIFLCLCLNFLGDVVDHRVPLFQRGVAVILLIESEDSDVWKQRLCIVVGLGHWEKRKAVCWGVNRVKEKGRVN